MKHQRPLHVDPIAEAKRQWETHGWEEAAPAMAAYASVMRMHQLMLSDVERVLKPFDLSFARYELLRLLSFTREGRMPMASVVSRLQVHPASVTSIVDRLVRDGYVTRGAHPTDGRAAMLAVTSSGAKLADEATLALNKGCFIPLNMSDEDIAAFTGIMARYRKQAGDFSDPIPAPARLEEL